MIWIQKKKEFIWTPKFGIEKSSKIFFAMFNQRYLHILTLLLTIKK